MIQSKEWFFEWFNSPYYHLLYQNRNEEEARLFVNKLSQKLSLQPSHKILDLGCGKGRHAIYLNKLGFEVMGVDLSKANIAHANWFANNKLKFRVHDMRSVVKEHHFDFVLNLFTSFGYFEDDADNQKAINAVAGNLKSGGKFILDFFNTPLITVNLIPNEIKVLGGVTFSITRELIDGYIVKTIDFDDEGKEYSFEERVRAITEVEFRDYFEKAGLKVVEMFGSYDLDPYRENTSERMIFMVEKL